MAQSPPFKLHPELVRLILEQIYTPPASFFLEWEDKKIEQAVLYALCLTSKTINPQATRLLYANMTEPKGDLQYKFLGTIEKKPALAALVQCYHTPHLWYQQNLKGRLFGRIRRSLQLMVNLKELSVSAFAGGYPSKIYPTLLKDGNMPFQLTTFAYNVKSPSAQCRDEVLGFLATQVELKRLTWMPNTSIPPEYLKTISHKLIRLEASDAAINHILPGRSIKELRWNTLELFKGNEFKAPINRTRMMSIFKMPEFRSLTHLFLLGGTSIYLLEHLAQLDNGPFEKLEVLSDDSIEECSSATLIRQLRMFPKLHTLVVPYSNNRELDSSVQKEKLIEVFEAHQNIQCAYELRRDYACADEYRRWTRGNDGTVKSQFCGLKTGYPLVRYVHQMLH